MNKPYLFITEEAPLLWVVLQGSLYRTESHYVLHTVGKKIKEGFLAVLIDFELVEYMNSLGISMIMGIYKATADVGGGTCLYSVPHDIKDILELADVDVIVPTFKDKERAKEYMEDLLKKGDKIT